MCQRYNADQEAYQRVCEPIRKNIGYISEFIQTHQTHHTRSDHREPTIVDEHLLGELDTGIENEGVSSTTRTLVPESISGTLASGPPDAKGCRIDALMPFLLRG